MYDLESLHRESRKRSAIAGHRLCDEAALLPGLLRRARLPPDQLREAGELALQLAAEVRAVSRRSNSIQSLLNEYSLSTHEGVVLMCLAEALLRVPDSTTADRLIRDKLLDGDWSTHLGASDSLFVNASAWGLLVSGRVVSYSDDQHLAQIGKLQKRLGKLGMPVVRAAMRQAMKTMGGQFVLGRTIDEALERSQQAVAEGYCYSFDMLGEASRTRADADTCFRSCLEAIEKIGRHNDGRGVHYGAGISVKLSAIHPRYEFSQYQRVMTELVDRLKTLALLAKQHDIGLTVDAEEAERLDLCLDVIEAVYRDDDLGGWAGFGVVVQAYMKRAIPVVEWLAELARDVGRPMMVRLVKGAYWDSEIKLAQVQGLAGYPVFTRKENTDVSYLACAALLLDARDSLYPQFATHNAYSVAWVLARAGEEQMGFEFQRLHGMGDGLYDRMASAAGVPVRIYAPVGEHRNLLAYLVRRLLENGANSSFVNNIIDENIPLEKLVADPCARASANRTIANPGIPLPSDLYGGIRKNSPGVDLHDALSVAGMSHSAQELLAQLPLGCGNLPGMRLSVNPARPAQVLGGVPISAPGDMHTRMQLAHGQFELWSRQPYERRATHLESLAGLLELHMGELVALCTVEAGKTVADGVAEVREAIDFCRYYASEGLRACAAHAGWGRAGLLQPRGVVLCISPWNFPLAIFLGQVCAALATGNSVLAKPADQTVLIARRALGLIREAGFPRELVQLIVADGSSVERHLLCHELLAGVMFTGSTQVGLRISRTLAARAGPRVPLVAETGGQNCMVVDSSALPEQVVDDVITSGFRSAGQRCSSLRVLFLQEEVADEITTMIVGAMGELVVGDPARIDTDVGPVIDQRALDTLHEHVAFMKGKGRLLYTCRLPGNEEQGMFFAPRLYEIENLEVLRGEVFGPVVHIVRYRADQLDEVVASINATGYGLTAGIHSRVGATTRFFSEQVKAGNIYINRNMVGAVVGVQPFGGHGLSGTGPKAGGAHYLYRLLQPRGAEGGRDEDLLQQVTRLLDQARDELCGVRKLPGPTGELNQWLAEPRGTILAVDEGGCGNLGALHIVAALATGNRVLHVGPTPLDARLLASAGKLLTGYSYLGAMAPSDLESYLTTGSFDALSFAGGESGAKHLHDILVRRSGPQIPLIDDHYSPALLQRFVLEKSISTDTTAAGGNASLLVQS